MTMNRIKELRELRGESQGDLARVLNISQPALSKWESEQTDPDIEGLITIANRYKVSIDYLLGVHPNEKTRIGQHKAALREYLSKKFNRVYSDEDIDTVDKILELLEKYREDL